MNFHSKPPQADGLYDPRYEHDACGVAMIARLDNEPSHEVVDKALTALDNLEHRGAEGADTSTGDGAGILVQLPDAFFRAVCEFELPPAGQYGVGVCFLPADEVRRTKLEELLELNVRIEGQRVLGWRDVPIDEAHVGDTANRSRPYMRQLFVGGRARASTDDQDAFERKLYVIRRIVELAAGPGLLLAELLLADGRLQGDADQPPAAPLLPRPAQTSASPRAWRWCTRASRRTRSRAGSSPIPYRVICPQRRDQHADGQRQLDARARVAAGLRALRPATSRRCCRSSARAGSDSATFDNVLELLMLARPLAAARGDDDDPRGLRGPRRPARPPQGLLRVPLVLHGAVGRPGRGRFTDGRVVGATLDRNGLRPGRWCETKDGCVMLGSETGMLRVDPAERQAPRAASRRASSSSIDLEEGRIVEDEEVKRSVATQQPYGEWYDRHVVHFNDLEEAQVTLTGVEPSHLRRLAFGYSQEDLRVLIAPMASRGRGADRLDGQRRRAGRPLRAAPAAVQLLQAALRAGHQPADRPDPRVDRHVAGHGRRRRAQPARRDARARSPAGHGPADPAQRRARDAAPRLARHLPRAHDRHHLAGRRGPAGHGARAGRRLRRGDRRRRRRHQHPDPLRPRGRARSARRSRRCWRSPRSTTTSCARARACARGSCSSPASRARSTTSRR